MFLGTIYNITPYMDFHPGGVPELMRAAGIDGTLLFDEVCENLYRTLKLSIDC